MMTKIFDDIKERLLLLILLAVASIGGLIAIAWSLFAILVNPKSTRARAVLRALGRATNASLGGDEKETISSRLGRAEELNKPYACVICRFLSLLVKNHCKKSIGI
jgi:hypothetical protein